MMNPVTPPADDPAASTLLSGRDDIGGTRVFGPAGEELGHIDDVMIDAASGKVVYGVLQFGGFLGIGSDYHPIPFGKLRYDRALGGYVTDLTREQLEGAPAYAEDWRADREWQRRSYEHYGLSPYWFDGRV